MSPMAMEMDQREAQALRDVLAALHEQADALNGAILGEIFAGMAEGLTEAVRALWATC